VPTHIVFEAWKSKGEESLKTICVDVHGFSSLENLCALVHSPYENNHRRKKGNKIYLLSSNSCQGQGL